MNLGTAAFAAALVCACAAEKWQWPEGASSVRIDTKVRFIDEESEQDDKHIQSNQNIQADDPQFSEPTNTEGFYNRPPGDGRYPVLVEAHRAPYRVNEHNIYSTRKSAHMFSDGTLDSLRYCKCLSTPDCNPSPDSVKACGHGKFLCCYKRPNKNPQKNTEFFNEVEDERPVLLPSQGERAGPFPPPPDTALNGVFGPGHAHDASLGVVQQQPAYIDPHGHKRPILIGPGGPTGIIGPAPRPVLVGPEGPTDIIGAGKRRGVLVGPGGPTGIIGPEQPNGINGPQQNRGVLVGPGGPTGIIGPANNDAYAQDGQDIRESAQRGVLVGPGGPTGIIGPMGLGRRGILVGPGGPTGVIGPYGRQNPAVLVGPGGPTGMIGPPRRRPFYYGK